MHAFFGNYSTSLTSFADLILLIKGQQTQWHTHSQKKSASAPEFTCSIPVSEIHTEQAELTSKWLTGLSRTRSYCYGTSLKLVLKKKKNKIKEIKVRVPELINSNQYFCKTLILSFEDFRKLLDSWHIAHIYNTFPCPKWKGGKKHLIFYSKKGVSVGLYIKKKGAERDSINKALTIHTSLTNPFGRFHFDKQTTWKTDAWLWRWLKIIRHSHKMELTLISFVQILLRTTRLCIITMQVPNGKAAPWATLQYSL